MRAFGQRRQRIIPIEPDRILFGGDEAQTFAVGARQQRGRLLGSDSDDDRESFAAPGLRARPLSAWQKTCPDRRCRRRRAACGRARRRWRRNPVAAVAQKTGMARSRRRGDVTSVAPDGSPTTSTAWTRRELRSRAAPATARPGRSCRCRCRAGRPPRDGAVLDSATEFCKPSSITTARAPRARANLAPATRSCATMVGAQRASSNGSSPTSAARWQRRIDLHRPASRPP